MKRLRKKGSVLILALWTLSFLGFFAISIGLRIRQRAELISRIDKKSQIRNNAKAGLFKALSALRSDLSKNNYDLTAEAKAYRYNNSRLFSNISLSHGFSQVTSQGINRTRYSKEKIYGVVDEESKININTSSKEMLEVLIKSVLDCNEEQSGALASAIMDWRAFGQSQVVGFYSDNYYSNLKDPYEPKNAKFELLDELSLLNGFDAAIVNALFPYVTIYGDGKVNINTAPFYVLKSLGFNDSFIEKFLFVRRGKDGIEATGDDHIFHKLFDVPSEMMEEVELKEGEMKHFDQISSTGRLKTSSLYYTIHSQGFLDKKSPPLSIVCVYDGSTNQILYWHEK